MSSLPEHSAGETRIPGFCALCRSRCGCISVVQDGKLVAVEPNPEHPTGQALCAKGRAVPEMVYSPDRLLYPIKRTAPKGAADPGWQRISWDEALDMTANALDRVRREAGAHAVAFSVTTPSGTAMGDAIPWVERLIRSFGSPNTVYGTEICNWHKDNATAFTFGAGVGSPDYERAGCIIHWGHNPNTAWLVHAQRTAAAKARGAKLVVVDPRRAGGAVKADQWLRVRPGYDGALALAIAGVMIDNGWYDETFLRHWSTGPFLIHPDTGRYLSAADLDRAGAPGTYVAWDVEAAAPVVFDPKTGDRPMDGDIALTGSHTVGTVDGPLTCRTAFDLYAELARDMTPARVEESAWVPASQVTETARLIWESGPVAYYAWSGVGQHTNATQTDRAISLLYALTGSYDAPGGNLNLSKVPVNDVSGKDLVGPEHWARGLEIEERPLGPGRDGWVTAAGFYRSVLESEPYKVRALVSFGTNMLVSHPDGSRGREALQTLDFQVNADMVLNPSAQLADVVLPIASAWEREGLRAGFEVDQDAEQLVQLRQPVIPPVGEARPDVWVVFQLAMRLGLGNVFWDGDVEAGLEHQLAPSGLSAADLRARPEGICVPLEERYRKYAGNGAGPAPGFATPSRRVEIYSQTFLDRGQTPLPKFVAPRVSAEARPDLAEGFPLVLSSAKSPVFCHSQYRNLPSLRRKARHPIVELHPDAAAARGVVKGDWVEIETPAGRMRAVAQLSPGLDPRVVVAQQGWWQACEELGIDGYGIGPDGGGSYNAVIGSDVADPISGSVPLRSYMCEVRAVEAG